MWCGVLWEMPFDLRDDAVYTVTYTVEDVDSRLTVTSTNISKAGEAAEGIVFINAYTPPEEPEPVPVDVVVSKQAVGGGAELPGARLQVLDSRDAIVEEWTSTEEPHQIALPEGVYTLREITAPDGYDVAEDLQFRIVGDAVECLAEGQWVDAQGLVVMFDAPLPARSEPVEVVLVKYLQDALIHASEFSFGLYDEAGNLLDTIHTELGTHTGQDAHTSSVQIAFKDLVFDKPGTYRYKIREHLEHTVEVVHGDDNHQQGAEPGFYAAGVKYDDREHEVVITVTEVDGKLVANVTYPDAADGVHLYNTYSEDFVFIDGKDSHPDDGLRRNEPTPSPEPEPEPQTDDQGEQPKADDKTDEQPKADDQEGQPKVDEQPKADDQEEQPKVEQASTPTPKVAAQTAYTPVARGTTARTSDDAPATLALALAALGAGGLAAIALRRMRRLQ